MYSMTSPLTHSRDFKNSSLCISFVEHTLFDCQVDVLDSSIPIPAPMTVDLEPGEVLYLPPYWFHCVMTLVPSISLNVWSDSDPYLLMEQILTAPVPFESGWSKEVLLTGVKYFVEFLVKKLGLRTTFVNDNVFSRSD